MKTVLVALCLVALLATLAMAAPPQGALYKGASPRSVDNEQYINVNNILMFVTNHGNFGRDLSGVFGNDYGTYFPYSTNAEIIDGSLDNSVVYASGLWMGARDQATGETRVIISEYDDEYVPGPMVGGTFQTDRPEFRVYKLYRDSLPPNANADYQDYLDYAVPQGAPFMLDTLGDTIPALIGDQMLWSVYNDADPNQHGNNAGSTEPLGVEVQHTTFAFNRTDPLGNIIFFRLQIYNKGGNTLEECYFSLWCDPDLGQFTDDLVGCDTNLSIGYCYNGDNDDNQFGSSPPCVGYDFFQGPLVFTGVDTDTARMWDTTFSGYVNLGMTSFNKYINGTDPDNFQETYNYMRGLNRDGSVYTYNGIPTKFFVSGDPVSGTGNLDFAPADRRFLVTTGPITFLPGDSTEILAAVIVGQGTDRKSSISFMRFNDKFAQDAYENSFVVPEPPSAPRVTVAVNDGRVALSWTDTSEVDNGTYPFEGYAVWQGESTIGPWTQIANFDLTNAVEDIFDEVPDPLTGAIEIRLVKNGTNQGVAHDIVMDEDFINGGPLYNLTTYFYKVDAYSYNPDAAVAKTLTSETVVRATPQSPIAGTGYEYNSGEIVDVIHIGGSDGTVTPYVVDPKLFDGSTYEIHFYDTVGFRVDTIYDPAFPGDIDHATLVSYDVVWHWINTTTGDTVIGWQWDQSGATQYENIDGLLLAQSGPPLQLNYWDWEGATRTLTGVDWGGSDFFGGIGFLNSFWGGAGTPTAADMVAVEIRWVDDGTGQNAYVYRRDDGYAYHGFHPQNIEVWDIDADPPRQLDFMFVEFYDPADDEGQNSDSVWNPGEQLKADGVTPADLGGREYFFVLNSTYSPTEVPAYAVDGALFDADILYNLWATYRTGDGKPDVGDVWTWVPNYINTPADTFRFTLSDTLFATGEDELDRINVVPNPFYLYGPYDPAPGNYQLKFQHLPGKCTIKIYNLSGDLVYTIDKTDEDVSFADWDAKTENGLPVASGIYIYVVEAPGFGTKIGKMAVFTEVEVLDTY